LPRELDPSLPQDDKLTLGKIPILVFYNMISRKKLQNLPKIMYNLANSSNNINVYKDLTKNL